VRWSNQFIHRSIVVQPGREAERTGHGHLRFPPVVVAAGEEGPDDPGILVRDRDNGARGSPAGDQRHDPLTFRICLAPSGADDGASTMHQQRAEMLIATLTDAAQGDAIPAGPVAWDEAKPGCHVSSVLEVTPVPDGGDDRRGGFRTDAFDLGDTLADRARVEDAIDAAVEDLDTVNRLFRMSPSFAREALPDQVAVFFGGSGQLHGRMS
jgi:hypothetical protein